MPRVSRRCRGRSRPARPARFRPSPTRLCSRMSHWNAIGQSGNGECAVRRRCACGSRGSARDRWRFERSGLGRAAMSRHPGRLCGRRAARRGRRRRRNRRRVGRASAGSPETPASGPPPRTERRRRRARADARPGRCRCRSPRARRRRAVRRVRKQSGGSFSRRTPPWRIFSYRASRIGYLIWPKGRLRQASSSSSSILAGRLTPDQVRGRLCDEERLSIPNSCITASTTRVDTPLMYISSTSSITARTDRRPRSSDCG